MKQSRRQELKTNELSVFLQQIYTSARDNANYVIGGLVAVVALLVIVLYVQHRRTEAREQAWNRYYELQGASVTEKPELMEQARAFAAQQRGNDQLGYRAAELAGDIAYQLAMSPEMLDDREKRLALLKDARDRYQQVIDQAPDNPAMVERARYSLAKIEENLLLAGESTKEKVRSLYEQIAKDEHGRYSGLAEEALGTLDERAEPLQLVATRPAETQPATAPATAPATLPAAAVGTRPAVTLSIPSPATQTAPAGG